MTWAQSKMIELEEKGRNNWDADDWEAAAYCEECFAEDERDNEYLGCYDILY